MSTTLVVLTVLAIWRLARIVTVDEVAKPLRQWVDARSSFWGYMVSCPWCFSVYLSPFVLIPVWWPDNRFVIAAVIALTASGVAGLLVTIEDRLDR